MYSSFVPVVIAWLNVFPPEPGIMLCMCWDIRLISWCRTMKWNRGLSTTLWAMHLSKQTPSPISLTMDQERKQLRPLLLLDRAELEWRFSRFSWSDSSPLGMWLSLWEKQRLRLMVDDWHGTVWLILPRFLLWVFAPWFEYARWIVNDEACIFVVANDRICGLTAYFSLLLCGYQSTKSNINSGIPELQQSMPGILAFFLLGRA